MSNDDLARVTEARIMAFPMTLASQLREKAVDVPALDPHRQGVIILVKDGVGYVPTFQLAPNEEGYWKIVTTINDLLKSYIEPWGVADWWLLGNGWLGCAPADLLGKDRDEDLLAAAKAELPDS